MFAVVACSMGQEMLFVAAMMVISIGVSMLLVLTDDWLVVVTVLTLFMG